MSFQPFGEQLNDLTNSNWCYRLMGKGWEEKEGREVKRNRVSFGRWRSASCWALFESLMGIHLNIF